MCASAITGAGLNTVNLSTLNTFQQVMLFLLIVFGSTILVSSVVLYVRKRAFETKFRGIAESRNHGMSLRRKPTFSLSRLNGRLQSPEARGASEADFEDQSGDAHMQKSRPDESAMPTAATTGGKAVPPFSSAENQVSSPTNQSHEDDHIRWADDDQATISVTSRPRTRSHHRVFPMAGVGARPGLRNHPKDALPNSPIYEAKKPSAFESAVKGSKKYFFLRGFISRNSQFYGLTTAERERLGGVEYKAVSFLSIVVPVYFLMFHVCGIVGVGCWLSVNRPSVARENGLSPFWVGAFFAASAFGNSGMALLDKNMTALQTSAYMLITMGMLILAGNTLYPCFLRFIIWTIKRLLPDKPSYHEWKVVLDFILDHPRRVYTNLFPARHTWYLLGTVIILNGIDWAGFELLSMGNKEVESLPTGYRILDGLFQAFAVRSGGFYVVTISGLRQGLLVLYVLMMYVSAFPVLVTIRNTNVYEERSLGIYADENLPDDQGTQRASRGTFVNFIRGHLLGHQESEYTDKETSRSYFVHQQLRSQLSYDIWWIALAVLIITIIESSSFERDPINFSTFNIIFEVVSAYGCVGISVGAPGQNYSFCGAWHAASKLILAAVAIRGRHRGLPVAIDKAVMLPNEALGWAEEEDAALRMERSRSRALNAEKSPVAEP
ncbi:hypothetical protein VTN00DRAFT_9478 [Thermoascus crustaceus]|uniref:uncharacterized protein n=1 Tax=Thermoascus crustaceus TaxID=5088 RepID=UPI003743D566